MNHDTTPITGVLPETTDSLPENNFDQRLPKSLPLWLVAFYLAFLIVRPWEVLFPWLGFIRFQFFYALLTIIAALFSRKTHMPGLSFQTASVVLLVIGLIASSFLGINLGSSLPIIYEYLTEIAFYFLLLMCVRSLRDMQFILAFYIGSMFFYLFKAHFEFFINGHHRYTMGVIRMVGIESTYGGPNQFALSTVVSMPFWLYLWKTRRSVLWFNSAIFSRFYTVFLMAFLCIGISSVIFSNSRSGMVAMIMFILISAINNKSFKLKLLYGVTAVLALLLIWVVMPEKSRDRLSTIWNPEAGPANAQVSAKGRLAGMEAGIEIFKDFPIGGVGIGNFIRYRTQYIDGISLNAHSLIGQALGETGLLGFTSFSLLILAILINTRRINNICRHMSGTQVLVFRQLGFACFTSLILLLFEGFSLHNMRRYNWLWVAAFAFLTLHHLKKTTATVLKTDNPEIESA